MKMIVYSLYSQYIQIITRDKIRTHPTYGNTYINNMFNLLR